MTEAKDSNVLPEIEEFMKLFCDLVVLNDEISRSARTASVLKGLLSDEVGEKVIETLCETSNKSHRELSDKVNEALLKVKNPIAVLLSTAEAVGSSYRRQVAEGSNVSLTLSQYEGFMSNLLEALMSAAVPLLDAFEKETGECLLCGGDRNADDHEDKVTVVLAENMRQETEKEDAPD